MALIKCKDCGSQVSKDAEKCPKCGAPVPKSTLYIILMMIPLIALLIFGELVLKKAGWWPF